MIYGYLRLARNPETVAKQRKTNKTFADGRGLTTAGLPDIKGRKIFPLSVETAKNNLPPAVSGGHFRQAEEGSDPFKKQGMKSERLKTAENKKAAVAGKEKNISAMFRKGLLKDGISRVQSVKSSTILNYIRQLRETGADNA